MNDLNSKIAVAKQYEQPDHAPQVDRTEQVNLGMEMAQRMANRPDPEPVIPQMHVMPVPN